MILAQSMMVCHAQHLATNFQGQGHNFDSNFGKKSTFPEYGHVAYQIKWNEMYNSIQANISPLCAPSTPGVGSKDQNIFFSENGHVAYQIKENDMYNNMQAILLSLHTLSTPGVGSKQFFSENGCVAYQIKGNEMYDNMQANILPLKHWIPGWG